MPALVNTLTANQVAAVVTYVRTHFGNHYSEPVLPEKAKAVIDAPPVPAHADELP